MCMFVYQMSKWVGVFGTVIDVMAGERDRVTRRDATRTHTSILIFNFTFHLTSPTRLTEIETRGIASLSL